MKKTSNSSTKRNPLVSVILPTFNRPKTLKRALKSVQDQNYENIEIIVVNDGGSDVEDVVLNCSKKSNIIYIQHSQNKGLAATRNTALKLAKGVYIAYLDDDDIYYPTHIGTLVNFLEKSNYKIAYCNAYKIHYKNINNQDLITKKELINNRFTFDRMLICNMIPVNCIMHHKLCLVESGIFDENLKVLEDWDLWIRMSRKYNFFHLKHVTCEIAWRENGSTLTNSNIVELINATNYIYNKYKHLVKNNPRIQQEQKRYLKISTIVNYELLSQKILSLLQQNKTKCIGNDEEQIQYLEQEVAMLALKILHGNAQEKATGLKELKFIQRFIEHHLIYLKNENYHDFSSNLISNNCGNIYTLTLSLKIYIRQKVDFALYYIQSKLQHLGN